MKMATLSPDDPTDALKIMRKVIADLRDGRPAIYWWVGKLYSRVPGERDRLLCTFEGMNIRASKTLQSDSKMGYGFRAVSKEILLFLHPETGQILHQWRNPWTNEECEVIHIANDPVNFPPMHANGPKGPYKFPGIIKDGHVFLSFEVPLFYRNPLGGDFQANVGGQYHANEMFSFFARKEDLLDGSRPCSADIDLAWFRSCQWMPWMKMGDRAGILLWNGYGKKLESFHDLSPLVKDAIEKVYPEFKEPPALDNDLPNETSWTYFKKIATGVKQNPWKTV